MKKGLMSLAAATVAAVAFAIGAGALSAQIARSYTWYGELASVDQAARAITVKAQVSKAVSTTASGYKPGDKLMLVWMPVKGESDTVIYAPKFDVMKFVDDGYILPVEFVSADAAGVTMTFKTTVPDNVLQGLRSVTPGNWIKVTTPMHQGKDVAMLTAGVASARPDIKPPPPEPPSPVTDAPGRGRGRGRPPAPPVAAAPAGPGVPGSWNLNLTLRGNASGAECTFQVEQTTLTGTCGGNNVTGEVAGKQVKFKYSMSLGGPNFEVAFEATVDEAGTGMRGTMVDTAAKFRGEFSATKK